jgi:P-type Mg2+ transporter
MLKGLTSEAARARLEQDGANEPAPAKHGVAILSLLGRLLNPLVVILLIAAGVAAFMGERVDASIIAIVVTIGVAIDFWQTYRSQRAADRLRERVTITATVLRDGEWAEVPRRDVVVGDVVRLTAGDLVPADAVLAECNELHVQEAALTGESLPVEKTIRDRVFLGTSVISGTGTAEVSATGPRTRFGAIAVALSARPQPTAFERGIHDFGLLILRVVFFLVLFILMAGLIMHRQPFETLLFAVALAVGLTPEFLPMITSVTLAQGAIRMAQHHVIVKHLASIQNFGSIDILCSDKTGTLTSGEMTVEGVADALGEPAKRPLDLARINSALQMGIRSPLDAAILKNVPGALTGFEKLDEIPFDFERRRLSIIVEHDGIRMLITKGAPESVLAVCESYDADGTVRRFEDATHLRSRQAFERMSRAGLRVLAVAYKEVHPQAGYSSADERAMILSGYISFADPPLPGIHETLAALKRDGIEIKILTGDNERVAEHVCSEVGLENCGIVTGEEIDRLSDAALDHIAQESTIFARVLPAQKTRILLALRRRGHVVGFLGDGINDAPSLRAADVGISVASAVDVAREAADIILLERGLRILHRGVLEGRKAFGNVMKYLLMGTSSNFGNMLSMAVAAFVLPFLPMLPTQILLNNLLYDLAQLPIPSDRVDESFLRKPQKWNITLVRNFMLIIGPISSIYDFLTFWVLLSFFHAGEAFFHTGWFVESLVTQTLVLFVIRTMRNPLTSRASRPLTITTLTVAAAAVLIPYTPLAGLLAFTRLPASFLAFVFGATLTYLLLVEIVKRAVFRPHKQI